MPNTIGIDMTTFVFITYVLALISLAISLWVAIELHYIRKQNERKNVKPRSYPQPTNTVYKSTAKGHWD